MTFRLLSRDLKDGGEIPPEFTCDRGIGRGLFPHLEWSHPPRGTTAFAVVVDDPDAIPVVGHVFSHLAMLNIAGSVRQLTQSDLTAKKGILLKNDFGERAWGGPCPPPNTTHRYRFTVLALRFPVDPSSVRSPTLEHMKSLPGVLGTASFEAFYSRRSGSHKSRRAPYTLRPAAKSSPAPPGTLFFRIHEKAYLQVSRLMDHPKYGHHARIVSQDSNGQEHFIELGPVKLSDIQTVARLMRWSYVPSLTHVDQLRKLWTNEYIRRLGHYK